MRPIRVLLAIVTSVVLTGCINSTTLVKLKADGSGTVEQTTLVNVAAMKSMMPGMQQSGQAPNLVNRADLERTAARMGKGVRLCRPNPRRTTAASRASRRSSSSTISTRSRSARTRT